MIYETAPKSFSPRFEIASCFLEHDGKIVLLHRHENKSQGGRWGLPAGKVEKGEDVKGAVMREIKEETGLEIAAQTISYFGKSYCRHGDYDFVFHMFSARMEDFPAVTINAYEHQAFAWRTPAEVIAMKREELVEDLDTVCKLFYQLS